MSIFEAFGGIRPMADHLHLPPSTVQSWKAAGRIPAASQPSVLDKGRALGLPITAEDVIFPLGRPAPRTIESIRAASTVAHCPTCDARAEHPSVRSCTCVDCPMRAAAAA